MTDIAVPGMAYAEVHRATWIARCPAPFCYSAMAITYGQAEFVCSGPGACGKTAPIVWPRDPEAIAAILRMRPDRTNQNWLPGETLQDLLAENAAHDCLPPDWLALDERTLLLHEVEGMAMAGLLADALPPAQQRLMIGGQ